MGPVDLPPSLSDYPGATAVWVNEVGGVTFEIDDLFIKWNPVSSGISLDDEVVRMEWVRPWHPVPEIVEVGADAAGEWLVTRAIDATNAITWPGAIAAREIGRGLRLLHDAAPVDDCPFDWSIESRLRPGLDLGPLPPIDRLVVCHGDACAPNTLIGGDGLFAANVDLGDLGVADRWADLAVASMSLGWNVPDGVDTEFFAGYGVEPDLRRIRFYRELWNSNS